MIFPRAGDLPLHGPWPGGVIVRFRACNRITVPSDRLGHFLNGGHLLLVSTIAQPYKTIEDKNSRYFARWFWSSRTGVACAKTDLGRAFNARNWSLFRSSLYLCNQKIYPPRHQSTVPKEPKIPDGPWQCVLYNDGPRTTPPRGLDQGVEPGFELADSTATYHQSPDLPRRRHRRRRPLHGPQFRSPHLARAAQIAREPDAKTRR